ncbi:hypothetical protein CsSME_00043642 [Camellia sinensis var. sinensis]
MATELVDIPVFKTCPHFEAAVPSPSFHSHSCSVFALEGTAFAPNLDLGTTGLQVLLRSKKPLRPSKEPPLRPRWFGTLHDRAKVKLALRDRASSYTCHPFPAESKWTTDHYRDNALGQRAVPLYCAVNHRRRPSFPP